MVRGDDIASGNAGGEDEANDCLKAIRGSAFMLTHMPISPELLAIYPETDGEPMGDSTEQIAWIIFLVVNFQDRFADDPNVFVAGNHFWYPVEGQPGIRVAPDTMIVFGRPKAHRSSYLQWLEAHVPPQVVFEVQSPGNSAAEMAEKRAFYDRYGVEEYYIYDFTRGRLLGCRRMEGGPLVDVPRMKGWVSPRLGVRFDLEDGELRIFHPDGRPFRDPNEVFLERDALRAELQERELQRARIAAQLDQVAAERDHLQQQLQSDHARIAALLAKLRDAGLEPEAE